MKKSVALTALTAAAALLAGCSESTKYVDSQGPDTVVSIDKVDIQDFAAAADSLLTSLYDSPAFLNSPRKPAIIAVSGISNETSTQFDINMLLGKIKKSITRSGKAEISAVVGTTQDALTKEAKAAQEFESGKTSNNSHDFTLVGKILESKTKAGSTKQTTYIFQLSVIRVATGTEAWSDEKLITKQGSKSSVGW
ncbi:MAG: penicillin-binding protein activator LpoB [Puniceicoccales bacterium]|jgi:uncharacterized protein (TIGR02722 family)|nr:penicillin-binding protein activator LpoB [Puniceicoccales bacterium]